MALPERMDFASHPSGEFIRSGGGLGPSGSATDRVRTRSLQARRACPQVLVGVLVYHRTPAHRHLTGYARGVDTSTPRGRYGLSHKLLPPLSLPRSVGCERGQQAPQLSGGVPCQVYPPRGKPPTSAGRAAPPRGVRIHAPARVIARAPAGAAPRTRRPARRRRIRRRPARRS